MLNSNVKAHESITLTDTGKHTVKYKIRQHGNGGIKISSNPNIKV